MNDVKKNIKKLVAAVHFTSNGEERTRWTTIGVAFENQKDGSWNLRFDYLPADMSSTTIQMRAFDPRSDEDGAQPS